MRTATHPDWRPCSGCGLALDLHGADGSCPRPAGAAGALPHTYRGGDNGLCVTCGDCRASSVHDAAPSALAQWTDAHQREALRRTFELAAELTTDRPHDAIWVASSVRNTTVESEAWWRFHLGLPRGSEAVPPFEAARIDAEVALVRQRVERPTATRAPLDLDAIETRANAATLGPMAVDKNTYDRGSVHYFIRTVEAIARRDPNPPCPRSVAWLCGSLGEYSPARMARGDYRDDPQIQADAEFIAAAWTDVPALVAEVRRLRANEDPTRDHAAVELLRELMPVLDATRALVERWNSVTPAQAIEMMRRREAETAGAVGADGLRAHERARLDEARRTANAAHDAEPARPDAEQVEPSLLELVRHAMDGALRPGELTTLLQRIEQRLLEED